MPDRCRGLKDGGCVNHIYERASEPAVQHSSVAVVANGHEKAMNTDGREGGYPFQWTDKGSTAEGRISDEVIEESVNLETISRRDFRDYLAQGTSSYDEHRSPI